MSASLLIAAGTVFVTACIVAAVLPILQRDMADTVERGTKPPADLTAVALMLLGGLLAAGIPASVLLLWGTWA